MKKHFLQVSCVSENKEYRFSLVERNTFFAIKILNLARKRERERELAEKRGGEDMMCDVV